MVLRPCLYTTHDVNNVSNFGGDPVTQLHFLKRFIVKRFTVMALHRRYAVTVSAAVATRSRADCSVMEDRPRKSLFNVL